ncbi:MAG: HD domain-containing protein [Anaerolineales bacterium]|nr:HD domain-containing protein [Anaerolineales bacterium]
MMIPSNQQAEDYLRAAAGLNPGPWVAHSRQVAQAARRIATQHPELEPEPAYSLGLLHDIGRRAGSSDMRHVLDGYHFLLEEGYPDAARICLTHSFPVPDPGAASGKWDVPAGDLAFVRQYLEQIEYTLYDRLIQLCDALCLPAGPVLMEKRLLDVALRHGFNEFTLPKWRAFLQIQAEFEAAIGSSIYQLLPGVIENTFLISISA